MIREGGKYDAGKGGKPKLVERTEDHPEGNRGARDADGKLRGPARDQAAGAAEPAPVVAPAPATRPAAGTEE